MYLRHYVSPAHTMSDIYIYSSQLASLIGQNIHKKWQESFEILWRRLDFHGYTDAKLRNGIVSEDEKIVNLSRQHAFLEEILTPPEPTSSSTSVAQGYRVRRSVLYSLMKEKVSDEELTLLDNVLRRNMYTQFGDTHEDRVFHHINTSVMKIVKDDRFHSSLLFTYKGYNVYLAGRVDGLAVNKNVIIEIKNRINRLFTYKTPKHEYIQCQAYLQLLPNTSHCLLIECLTKCPETKLVHVQKIYRDTMLWENQVMPKLRVIVEQLVDIIGSKKLQDDYFKCHSLGLPPATKLNRGPAE